MYKIAVCIVLLLSIWVFLGKCVIMQNRWSDEKAQTIFSYKKVPLEIHDTVINGNHLHYVISGSSSLPTLVFVHGSPGSWMNYAIYMWDTLLQKKFRIVSIDRPGFGYSNFSKALHLQEQAAIILPVLQSLKSEHPMFLCGHSMGGPVAVELAARDPNLFNTIIIAAGALDANLEKRETWRRVMNNKPLYWLLPGAFAPSNTELLYLKSDLIPLRQSFRKVTCKVHFIHGDQDTWVPIENVAYGKKMLVNARGISVDTIMGAGHLIPWKNKTEFTQMLLHLN